MLKNISYLNLPYLRNSMLLEDSVQTIVFDKNYANGSVLN